MMGPTDTSDFDLDQVRCRSYGHRWDEYVPAGKRRPPFGWRLSLLCTRCGTERHDLVDVAGQVLSREYVYPDGYTIRGGGLARADWRVELAARRERTNLRAVD